MNRVSPAAVSIAVILALMLIGALSRNVGAT